MTFRLNTLVLIATRGNVDTTQTNSFLLPTYSSPSPTITKLSFNYFAKPSTACIYDLLKPTTFILKSLTNLHKQRIAGPDAVLPPEHLKATLFIILIYILSAYRFITRRSL